MSILNPATPIAVEYDCRGERKVKQFANAYVARCFYTAKFKSGHNPKVRKAS